MRIKANPLLTFFAIVLVFGAVLFGVHSCSRDGGDQASTNQGNSETRQLTEEERKALGVEADSPQDTVATLVAQYRQMSSQLEDAQKKSEDLRDQNQRLADKNRDTQGRIDRAVSDQNADDKRQRQSLVGIFNQKLSNLQKGLSQSGNDQSSNANDDMPVGLGLDGDTPDGASGGMTWVNPLGATGAGNGKDGGDGDSGNVGSAFNTAFDSGKQAANTAGRRADQALSGNNNEADQGTPVYTVPKNSTLVGSVAMTALLGRVPVNGTVQDPYPFKVIIGGKNLTANGIELPEIKRAIVSGTATGDWTLSCVRGKVKSITFVFQDGRVRTVPKSDEPGEGKNDNDDDEIGYLSNPQGVPCVSGQRKTNARSYILTQLLLSAGAAGANAYAGGETTTSVSGLGTATGVTGNVGKYIAGSAASSGLNEVRQWIQKRFGQTFDAIYVPPGQAVAVNIDKQLPIDYEHQGRKVHYAHPTRSQGLD